MLVTAFTNLMILSLNKRIRKGTNPLYYCCMRYSSLKRAHYRERHLPIARRFLELLFEIFLPSSMSAEKKSSETQLLRIHYRGFESLDVTKILWGDSNESVTNGLIARFDP